MIEGIVDRFVAKLEGFGKKERLFLRELALRQLSSAKDLGIDFVHINGKDKLHNGQRLDTVLKGIKLLSKGVKVSAIEASSDDVRQRAFKQALEMGD
jgi:hypothetical protein